MSSEKTWQLCDDIRALRRSLDLTQQEFATELRRGLPAVSNWERGKFKPHRDVLLKMARLSDDEHLVEVFLRAARLPKHEWGPYYPGQRENVSRSPSGVRVFGAVNRIPAQAKRPRAMRAWSILNMAGNMLLDCAEDGVGSAEEELVALADRAQIKAMDAERARKRSKKEER